MLNNIHDSNMYTSAGIVLIVMIVSYILIDLIGRRFKQKIPVAILLFASCALGALAGGFGIPLRHLIEGEFGYIYINLVILTGMVLLQVMKLSGSLDAITWDIMINFRQRPVILFVLLTALLYFPGMVTGVGTAAVLSTGILVAVILDTVGIPKIENAAILALVTTFGAAAPPVNLPALIISGGINMPFDGFSTILWVLTIPVGLFSIFFIGYKHFKVVSVDEIERRIPKPERKNFLMPYVPLIVVAVLFAAIRLFPGKMPDLITPLVFMIGALVGLLTGKKVNFFQASREAMSGGLFLVVALLFVVGTVVQIMTLTGAKGLIVIGVLTLGSLFPLLMYISMGLSIPLIGGVLTHLGTSAILGVPFALALLTKNTIVVVAALSLICIISQLIPPSAVGGYFAQGVLELKDYKPILKKCIIPIIVSIGYASLVIVFAKYFAAAFVPY